VISRYFFSEGKLRLLRIIFPANKGGGSTWLGLVARTGMDCNWLGRADEDAMAGKFKKRRPKRSKPASPGRHDKTPKYPKKCSSEGSGTTRDMPVIDRSLVSGRLSGLAVIGTQSERT